MLLWAMPSIAGDAGTIEISAAGGKWAETGTWVGGVVPTAAEDVVAQVEGKSGNLTVAVAGQACRSLDLANYTKVFRIEAVSLAIGTTTAGPGNRAFRLSAGMTLTTLNGSTLEFVGTSATEQTIEMAGKSANNSVVKFNGAGGSWKFVGSGGIAAEVRLAKGKLNLGEQTFTWGRFLREGEAAATLAKKGSTIQVTATSLIAWNVASVVNFTLEDDATSTLKLAAPSGASATEFRGGNGLSYGNVIIEGAGTGSVTFAVAGCSFNKLDLSAAAGRVIKLAGEKTFTVKEAVATGSAGKLVTIESTTAGKAWILKCTSGTISWDYVSLKDSKAEGGATFYAGANSTNVSGNSGWTFTAPEAAPTVTTGEAPVEIAARLLGAVNPNGAATEVAFEWGTTEAYGQVTASVAIGSGHASVAVSAIITGLVSSTLYHYRPVATNGKGSTAGADQSFVAAGGAVVSVVL